MHATFLQLDLMCLYRDRSHVLFLLDVLPFCVYLFVKTSPGFMHSDAVTHPGSHNGTR